MKTKITLNTKNVIGIILVLVGFILCVVGLNVDFINVEVSLNSVKSFSLADFSKVNETVAVKYYQSLHAVTIITTIFSLLCLVSYIVNCLKNQIETKIFLFITAILCVVSLIVFIIIASVFCNEHTTTGVIYKLGDGAVMVIFSVIISVATTIVTIIKKRKR